MRFKAKAVHPIYMLRTFGMTELSAYLGDGWFKGYYVDGYIVGGFLEIDSDHTELEYWIPIDKSTLKIYRGSDSDEL